MSLSILCLFLFVLAPPCIQGQLNTGFTFFSDTLGQGGAIVALLQGQCILSKPLGLFSACQLLNGNFAVINQAAQTIAFSANSDKVATATAATAPFRAVMQSDNNFVVLGSAGQVLFQSNPIQVNVFLYLRVTDGGQIQLQDIADNLAWANGVLNPTGIQQIGILAGRTGYQFGLGGPNFGGVNLGALLPTNIYSDPLNLGSTNTNINTNIIQNNQLMSSNGVKLQTWSLAVIIGGAIISGVILACIVYYIRFRYESRTVIKSMNYTQESKIMSKPLPSNLANPNQIRPRLSLEKQNQRV